MKYRLLQTSVFALLCAFNFNTNAAVVEHSSGKCLQTQDNSASPVNGTRVVLNSSCSGAASDFSWTPGGSIRHVPSNKCIHPGGVNFPANGTDLVLWDGCDFADRVKFNRTSNGSIQQASSNKCVHPNGGAVNPANGTKLVMWDGCNEDRLAFTPKADSSITPPVSSGDFDVANASELINAVASASAGDIITLTSNFALNQAVTIDKELILEGNGKEISYTVPTGFDFAEYTPAIIVAATGVIIRNVTIDGNNRNGQNTLIQTNNRDNTRASNLSLFNVTLKNSTSGLRNQGIIPANLSVENSTFINLNKGIDITRDASLSNFTRVATSFVDAKGEQIFYQNAGSLIIRNNHFYVESGQAPMQVGIQIDGGNDGYNPVMPAPGFPNNTLANRGDYNNLVIKYNNGIIANNSGKLDSDPLRASEFPIALAKVADVTIEDNFVETVGTTTDQFDFSSGINVEHMSRDIIIKDNAIAVNRVVDAEQNNQGISILPYQDHGNNAESEEASVNIEIINNAFYGSGRSGIFGLAFRNLKVDMNNFNNFTPSRSGLSTMNFFNTDDNQNGTLEESERATLHADFTNFGATTNLGANGLVTATIFNTGDPSDLPPDQRH